ncbi:MAG TPA: CaiB/BaiF CoA-transferase family protein [Marmoricola sp.]|jgi:alpha-methylacyl-CoA racemase|nr:CaiB/BaiF CoA-transferase family protein [Marmoricola sp.]
MNEPSTSGPLSGVMVVELGGLGPVPFAGMTLAGMGASVVRVERPGGDVFFAGYESSDLLNRGKSTVALDLKSPEGLARCRALVADADIVLEGSRPGALERLGLGPDDVMATHPGLVYGRMTGWGQAGPRSATAGHDINYIALTGVLDAIGSPDGPPVVPLNVVGDFGGGAMYLVAGVLAALHQARATGQGDVVDAAIVDGVAHLLTGVHSWLASGRWEKQRGSNLLDGGAPFYATYETADGRSVAVGALEPQFFAALLRGLEIQHPYVQDDRASWPRLRAELAAAFKSRARDHWDAVFAQTDACVTPVLDLVEAADDDHLRARRAVVRLSGVVQSGDAPRFLGAGPLTAGRAR